MKRAISATRSRKTWEARQRSACFWLARAGSGGRTELVYQGVVERHGCGFLRRMAAEGSWSARSGSGSAVVYIAGRAERRQVFQGLVGGWRLELLGRPTCVDVEVVWSTRVPKIDNVIACGWCKQARNEMARALSLHMQGNVMNPNPVIAQLAPSRTPVDFQLPSLFECSALVHLSCWKYLVMNPNPVIAQLAPSRTPVDFQLPSLFECSALVHLSCWKYLVIPRLIPAISSVVLWESPILPGTRLDSVEGYLFMYRICRLRSVGLTAETDCFLCWVMPGYDPDTK